MTRPWLLLAALAFAFASCSETNGADRSERPVNVQLPESGEIVFARGRYLGIWHLYAIDLAGHVKLYSPIDLRQVTETLPASIYLPLEVSADGRWIAFSTATGDLYLTQPNSAWTRQVTSGSSSSPRDWAPDNERLLYGTKSFSGREHRVVNVEGGVKTLRELEPGGFVYGTWAPDGETIIFGGSTVEAGGRGGPPLPPFDLYELRLSDQTIRPLEIPAFGFHQFTSDGNLLITHYTERPTRETLTVTDRSGKELRVLAVTPLIIGAATESPDGSRVAVELWLGRPGNFSLRRYPASRIVIVPASRSKATELAKTDGVIGREPTWSPDGTKLAFVRGSIRNGDLWVMNADGTGLRQLTRGLANDHLVRWVWAGTSR